MDFGGMATAALKLALWLSVPASIAAVLVSVLLALIQLTRGHEATLGFVPKLFAVGLALWLSREFMSRELTGFAGEVFRSMALIAR